MQNSSKSASATKLANSILPHDCSRNSCVFQLCAITRKNLIVYLASWHNSIFDYKLRTD